MQVIPKSPTKIKNIGELKLQKSVSESKFKYNFKNDS
jgi:hypothetical protein